MAARAARAAMASTAARGERAATGTNARILRLNRTGTVAVTKEADFVVLDANPLDDIANTTRIAQVYLNGQPLDRAALRASFK